MPSNTETILRTRMPRTLALLALAVAACAGLAGCGGGSGSGGGKQVTIVPQSSELQPSEPQAAAPQAAAPRTPGAEPPSPARAPASEAQVLRPGPKVPGPDLVAEGPGVNLHQPVTGAHLRVGAVVRNVGDKGAAATWARLYRSRDARITESDTSVYVEKVPGLAPSHSKYVWRHLTTPSAPGTYYYGMCVDAVEGESNTANNCSAAAKVTVRRAPRPDLVVTSPSVSPASPAIGGVFGLTVKVRNAGEGTEPFWLRTYRSDDATFTSSDPQVGGYSMYRGLSSFNYGFKTTSLDTPSSAGTYYYRVCADVVAGESNTANNCSAPVRVDVTHSKPNLQINATGVGKWVGNTFSILVELRNTGGPSATTTLRFYRSTDETITTADTEVGSITVPPLAKKKNQFSRVPLFNSGWVYVPGPSTPGAHHYGACVDPLADESVTTDNCSWVITTIWR